MGWGLGLGAWSGKFKVWSSGLAFAEGEGLNTEWGFTDNTI